MKIYQHQFVRLLTTLSICFISNTVISQTIATDRPDQTEASTTIPRKALQIETGILSEFIDDENTSVRTSALPNTLFRYGLTDGFELRVVKQLTKVKPNDASSTTGLSDLQLGAKIQIFRKESSKTTIAFLTHAVIPVGNEFLSSDRLGTVNKLCISHELPGDRAISYNVGYDNFGFGDGTMFYSLAYSFAVNDKIGVFLEPYGTLEEFTDHFANFDAGVTYLAHDQLQFDASFGFGLNYSMNFISAGVSWLILSNRE